ncbi:MAG: hypothetical protein ABI689_18715 [Thermoanaerobaculia bacterium]
MKKVRNSELPLVGMSHPFVGAEQGGVGASIYFVRSTATDAIGTCARKRCSRRTEGRAISRMSRYSSGCWR